MIITLKDIRLCVIVVLICISLMISEDFPGGSDGKASVYSVGDLGSIPGLGRSPGEGNGNPLQYSCLENLIKMGVLYFIWMEEPGRLQSVGLESDTTEQLHWFTG